MQEINNIKALILDATNNLNNSSEIQYHKWTIWMTQKMIWELFEVPTNLIKDYLKKSFNNKELSEYLVPKKFSVINSDWNSFDVNFYQLEWVILTGFRINPERAGEFSEWTGDVIKNKKELLGLILEWEKDILENWTISFEEAYSKNKEYIKKI